MLFGFIDSDFIDSGWLRIIPTKYNSNSVLYRKIGAMVNIQIANRQLSGLTANADNHWFTLPEGFRPHEGLVVPCYNGGFFIINTAGEVKFNYTATSKWVSLNITFFTV